MDGDPQLVPRRALSGSRIAISVSESSDLERLGLSKMHLILTVAELTRAIVFAGGIVVYGGAINWGFTKVVLDETEKYGHKSGAFEHFVPYTEHVDLSPQQLSKYAASLAAKSAVQLLDADGTPHSIDRSRSSDFARRHVEQAVSLTAMRTLTAEVSDARIVVGGKVAGFSGAMPGVAEEAACTAKKGKPIYVAGGFGGAATLVGSIVAPKLYEWMPPDLPSGLTGEVRDVVSSQFDVPLAGDGLTDEERAVLAVTHRPSDIATLVVLGLSRQVEGSTGSG